MPPHIRRALERLALEPDLTLTLTLAGIDGSVRFRGRLRADTAPDAWSLVADDVVRIPLALERYALVDTAADGVLAVDLAGTLAVFPTPVPASV